MNERMISSKKLVLFLIETESVYIVFIRTFFHLCLQVGSVTSYGGWFIRFLPHSIFNLFFLCFHTTMLRNAVVKIIAYISKSPCIKEVSIAVTLTLQSCAAVVGNVGYTNRSLDKMFSEIFHLF